MDLSTGFGILGAGSILAFLGTILTMRTGRMRDFDARSDQRAKDLEVRNRELEADNDKLMEEQARLRFLLRTHGIDPDAPAVTV